MHFFYRKNFADSAIDRRSSKPMDWSSSYGDLVRRAYWHCAILETGLHLELDLPLTGLLDHNVESVIFQHSGTEETDDDIAHEVTQFRTHYTAQLTLRRLCAELHDKINECRSRVNFVNRIANELMNVQPWVHI